MRRTGRQRLWLDLFRRNPYRFASLRQASSLEYLDLERRVTLTMLDSHCAKVWERFCKSLIGMLFSSRGHESSLAMQVTVSF